MHQVKHNSDVVMDIVVGSQPTNKKHTRHGKQLAKEAKDRMLITTENGEEDLRSKIELITILVRVQGIICYR